MALARKVHAAAMAAEDPETTADLARAYQRVARSVRQTLALKGKLEAERNRPAGQARDAALAATLRSVLAQRTRRQALHEAVERVIRHEMERADYDTPDLAAWVDRRMSEAAEMINEGADDDEDFAAHDLDTQVRMVCAAVGLAPEAADRWRTLPTGYDPPRRGTG